MSQRDAQPASAPPSVRTAVKCMYAGAALSALTVVIGLVSFGSLKNAIETAARQAHRTLTASQLHSAEVGTVVAVLSIGLIGVGLWVWMAWANGRGRSWARIIATVLFALNTLDLIFGLARPHVIGTTVLGILIWLAGLGAIIMLYRPESSAYIQATSQAGYGYR